MLQVTEARPPQFRARPMRTARPSLPSASLPLHTLRGQSLFHAMVQSLLFFYHSLDDFPIAFQSKSMLCPIRYSHSGTARPLRSLLHETKKTLLVYRPERKPIWPRRRKQCSGANAIEVVRTTQERPMCAYVFKHGTNWQDTTMFASIQESHPTKLRMWMRRLTHDDGKAGWMAIGSKPAANASNGRVGSRSSLTIYRHQFCKIPATGVLSGSRAYLLWTTHASSASLHAESISRLFQSV